MSQKVLQALVTSLNEEGRALTTVVEFECPAEQSLWFISVTLEERGSTLTDVRLGFPKEQFEVSEKLDEACLALLRNLIQV